jgi:response regulator NasT
MGEFYSIAIADDNESHRTVLELMLQRAGHRVVLEASSGTELIEMFATIRADLVVADIRMPGLDGLETAERMWASYDVPFIFVSSYVDDQIVEKANTSRASAFLMKPIREPDLLSAIAVAMHRSAELKQLRTEAIDMRQALADRKIIERAKGILMAESSMTENDAYKFLQQIARKKRQKLVDVANGITLLSQALDH